MTGYQGPSDMARPWPGGSRRRSGTGPPRRPPTGPHAIAKPVSRGCSAASRVNLAPRCGYAVLDAPCALRDFRQIPTTGGPVSPPPFWTSIKPALPTRKSSHVELAHASHPLPGGAKPPSREARKARSLHLRGTAAPLPRPPGRLRAYFLAGVIVPTNSS